MSYPNYKPGLEGVIAAITKISYLDTEKEQIIVRGYDLIELIEKTSYIKVAYLLLYNRLPSDEQAKEFEKSLMAEAEIPDSMYQLFSLMPKTTQAMDALRTGISFLAGYEDPDFLMDTSTKANEAKALKILAKAPTIAVNSYRALKGMPFVRPNRELGYAENFIYMIKGEKPTATEVDTLDKILTAYIEHEMPNSTFAVRVVASTLSDIYGAITSAVASLKGPLHGGANEAAMKMFLEVLSLGGVKIAEKYILEKLARKDKIMGFGHRVYMKKYDPRAYLLKDYIPKLAHLRPEGAELAQIYEIIAKVMEREKGIFPNADYPIALLYYLIHIPIDLYTPIFLCSRIAGLAAHHIEQHENNRLFRPRVIYEGERDLHP
ncbi:MAG: citrate synthase [Leptospiraceae bacterium]|nr:citrate synthase [Leptospiraceae bacterium]MDW8305936.1 citrate/2-methylcitrate synthase [Leptospiraceae bacterium]